LQRLANEAIAGDVFTVTIRMVCNPGNVNRAVRNSAVRRSPATCRQAIHGAGRVLRRFDIT